MSGLVARFRTMALDKKIFFSILVVILTISLAIALLARWILVSSLTDELEHRGVAVARDISERARGFMLDEDKPGLVSLVFDAALLGERRDLVSYILVLDQEGQVRAHTFIRPVPEGLAEANRLPRGRQVSLRAVTPGGAEALDIAVPVTEGISRLGEVHVGLNQDHVDALVGKLRITFLGFISAIIVVVFFISLRLSANITRPLKRLTAVSDALSRGDFDVTPEMGERPPDCPAYRDSDLPCWHYDQMRGDEGAENLPRACATCNFYRSEPGDEVSQLADSFRNMVFSIKLYRRRLRESEEKYRSLFVSAPDPILVVAQDDLEILDANPRAEEVYGYPAGGLVGGSFAVIDPDFGEVIAGLEARSGECAYRAKFPQFRADGEPIYVNLHACPISYRGRQAVIVAAADVTEMMEKDAQLIQASKMKSLGEMSAGIAHELNQPLNAVKMGADFLSLASEQPGGAPQEHLARVAEEISRQVDRAAEIIDTLRGFGRKADARMQPVDVADTAHAVLRLIGRQLELADVRLVLNLPGDLPRIRAQGNRLQQVVFNLIVNARDAVEHNQRRGRIEISAWAENGRVMLRVADNGPGIPSEVRAKVFEPFYTTKETGLGMGLGLAISYGIVQDFGGDIRIDEPPRGGAAFTLSFPAAGGNGAQGA